MTDVAYILLTVVIFAAIAVIARRFTDRDAGAPVQAPTNDSPSRPDGGDR